MEYEILRLIYKYSKQNKLVDVFFIDKIVEIFVSKNGLKNYIQKVNFTNKLEKDNNGLVIATYNPFAKEILIDFESIFMTLEDMCYYNQLFNQFEQVMFQNLIITQIILHELEHALQAKKTDDKTDNSNEAKLICASYIVYKAMKNQKFVNKLAEESKLKEELTNYIKQQREIDDKYYHFIPIERLAQVNSFNIILELIKPIKDCVPNLYQFNQASLVEEMIKGYTDAWDLGICPTQVYLYASGQSNVWDSLDFYDSDSERIMKKASDKYSLEKRLTLGLPVNYQEYSKMNNWLQTTNKFNV